MSRLTKPLLFASPEECEQAFYEALAAGDAEAVVDLWLDDEEVCCVHPGGGRLVGHHAVKASWTATLAGGALPIRALSRRCFESAGVTVSHVIEEIVVTRGRQREVVQVLATNAFVKTPAGWKMVLHHAAPAPQGQAQDVEGVHGTVH